MHLRAVLEARRRVMLEMNISADLLESLARNLPSMREPTISPLHGSAGFAVKVAVLRDDLSHLIPMIKACGGTDIVVTSPSRIVP